MHKRVFLIPIILPREVDSQHQGVKLLDVARVCFSARSARSDSVLSCMKVKNQKQCQTNDKAAHPSLKEISKGSEGDQRKLTKRARTKDVGRMGVTIAAHEGRRVIPV